MTQPFQLQRPQIVDSRGVPIRGAKAFFYDADTGIRKRAFRNAEKTEDHPWPVVADSAGRFPMIYLADGLYKVVAEDEFGRQIYSDPKAVIGAGASAAISADFRLQVIQRFQSAILTADDANTIQDVTADGYPVTMLIGSATDVGNGKIIGVRKAGGDSAVIAKTSDGSKINGFEQISLVDQYQYILLVSDGGSWLGLTINQAAQISFSPTGLITATDVQSAIAQIDARVTDIPIALYDAYDQLAARVLAIENSSGANAQQLFTS